MTNKVDFIIVGQGIAGSLMAYSLLKANKKILVIDKHNPLSASNIATGIVNPITGRKMVKTWMIDDVLPIAKSTYKDLEQELKSTFFFEQDIYKIFTTSEDVEIWNQKKDTIEYQNYLGDIVALPEIINAPYGAGIIKQSCWMDIPKFIKLFRAYLKHKNCLLEETLDRNQLQISSTIQYQNIVADKIIFCEGYKAHENPLFNFIPFTLAKGEQFLIQTNHYNSEKILNKNIILIPKGNQLYNVGATFIWNDTTEVVTDKGRTEITEKLNKLLKDNYQMVEEKSGIRPTTKDRRPVVGKHPKYENVYIFNGMGTKGVSLAPYFAQYFTDCLLGNTVIFKEISLNRFVD